MFKLRVWRYVYLSVCLFVYLSVWMTVSALPFELFDTSLAYI